MLRIRLPLLNIASAIEHIIQRTGFRLSIATRPPTIEGAVEDAQEAAEKEREVGDEDEDEDDGGPGRRTFCAPLLSRTYHQYDGATLLRPSFNSRVQPSRCETDNKNGRFGACMTSV